MSKMKNAKKKVALMLATGGVAVAFIPMFAAFEAHVINVTAKIQEAIGVNTKLIEFGTAFPQERMDEKFDVSLSQTFLDQGRVDDVEYMIRQKPKCMRTASTTDTTLPEFGLVTEDADGHFVCEDAAHYEKLPLLCPYLSKHEVTVDAPENDTGIGAFHGLPGEWTASTTIATQVLGHMAKSEQDILDTWNIDFRVPCFKGSCAQDWKHFVQTESGSTTINYLDYQLDPAFQGKLLGCDLWVEVTGISTSTQPTPTPTPTTTPSATPSPSPSPQIVIHKIVTGPEVGTTTPADFQLFIDGVLVANNSTTTVSAGAHFVTENPAADGTLGVVPFSTVFSGDCTDNVATGTISVLPGDIKTCTITNTFSDVL